MTADPRATVVIMTRDRRSELLRTLRHMTALPERPPIIVVDNASGDGTADAVAEAFPGVRLIRADRNLGAVARNLAVERVTTPYVAFCDDDTWWEPGAVARAAGLLERHPRLASVTGLILVEPDLEEDPITPELRHSPVPAPAWMPGPALLSILAGASMLRVSAFREVGGFSPRLWLGGEEELLSIDLAARGWWLCWAEDVVVHHQASTARDPRERRRVGIRNTLWTAWLRRPLPSAARRTATMLRSIPRDPTSVRAVAEAVAALPWVLRERRVIPDHLEYGLRLLEEPQRTSPRPPLRRLSKPFTASRPRRTEAQRDRDRAAVRRVAARVRGRAHVGEGFRLRRDGPGSWERRYAVDEANRSVVTRLAPCHAAAARGGRGRGGW